MAIGNAVGSVTANTGLILAIALICIPTAIKRSEYALKSVLLICAHWSLLCLENFLMVLVF